MEDGSILSDKMRLVRSHRKAKIGKMGKSSTPRQKAGKLKSHNAHMNKQLTKMGMKCDY